jgi:hypothetical protein
VASSAGWSSLPWHGDRPGQSGHRRRTIRSSRPVRMIAFWDVEVTQRPRLLSGALGVCFGSVGVDADTATRLLRAIIARERADGCVMADEILIQPALRRWRSYDRRFRRDKSLAHRARDLEKGLIELFPGHTYDPGCVRHLAEQFAEALSGATSGNAAGPGHAGGDRA